MSNDAIVLLIIVMCITEMTYLYMMIFNDDVKEPPPPEPRMFVNQLGQLVEMTADEVDIVFGNRVNKQ